MKIIWIIGFLLFSLLHPVAHARHEIGTQYFDVHLSYIHQLVDVQPNDALVFVDDAKSNSVKVPSTLIIPKMARPVILVITNKSRDIKDFHLKVHPKTHVRAIIVDKQAGNIIGSHAPIYRLSEYNPRKWTEKVFPKCTCEPGVARRHIPILLSQVSVRLIYARYQLYCSSLFDIKNNNEIADYIIKSIDILNKFSQEIFHRDFDFFVSFTDDIHTIKLSSKHTRAYYQKHTKREIAKRLKQKSKCERKGGEVEITIWNLNEDK